MILVKFDEGFYSYKWTEEEFIQVVLCAPYPVRRELLSRFIDFDIEGSEIMNLDITKLLEYVDTDWKAKISTGVSNPVKLSKILSLVSADSSLRGSILSCVASVEEKLKSSYASFFEGFCFIIKNKFTESCYAINEEIFFINSEKYRATKTTIINRLHSSIYSNLVNYRFYKEKLIDVESPLNLDLRSIFRHITFKEFIYLAGNTTPIILTHFLKNLYSLRGEEVIDKFFTEMDMLCSLRNTTAHESRLYNNKIVTTFVKHPALVSAHANRPMRLYKAIIILVAYLEDDKLYNDLCTNIYKHIEEPGLLDQYDFPVCWKEEFNQIFGKRKHRRANEEMTAAIDLKYFFTFHFNEDEYDAMTIINDPDALEGFEPEDTSIYKLEDTFEYYEHDYLEPFTLFELSHNRFKDDPEYQSRIEEDAQYDYNIIVEKLKKSTNEHKEKVALYIKTGNRIKEQYFPTSTFKRYTKYVADICFRQMFSYDLQEHPNKKYLILRLKLKHQIVQTSKIQLPNYKIILSLNNQNRNIEIIKEGIMDFTKQYVSLIPENKNIYILYSQLDKYVDWLLKQIRNNYPEWYDCLF